MSVRDETSDFKFGRHQQFANAHHKITPKRKSWRGHRLGEVHKILGFPFHIRSHLNVLWLQTNENFTRHLTVYSGKLVALRQKR